jgi:hypothetical protein
VLSLAHSDTQAFRHPTGDSAKRIGIFHQTPQERQPFWALQVDEDGALAALTSV